MGCWVFLQVFLVELFCGEIWEHFGLVLWPVWGHPGLPFREFLSRSTQPEYLNLTCHQESCPLLWVIPVLEPVRLNVKYHL